MADDDKTRADLTDADLDTVQGGVQIDHSHMGTGGQIEVQIDHSHMPVLDMGNGVGTGGGMNDWNMTAININNDH